MGVTDRGSGLVFLVINLYYFNKLNIYIIAPHLLHFILSSPILYNLKCKFINESRSHPETKRESPRYSNLSSRRRTR